MLNWFASLSSAIDVAVVARVAACFAGSGPLKAQRIFDFTAHGAALSSRNQKGDEYRNNLVQESLEHRLYCSSDLANSSGVGNGLPILAAPQSGHPISVFRVRRIALLSIVEVSHAPKQLSALFQS